MAVRIAISGFGRIGRNVLRAIAEAKRKDLQVVAINDLFSAKDNAHLLRYDSVHGRFPGEVKVEGDSIDVGYGPDQGAGRARSQEAAVEGARTSTSSWSARASSPTSEKAAAHLEAGAKRVLVSAPSKGADLTVVYGVNHDKLDGRAQGGLERLLHHQLPGAGGQGAERPRRHQVGLHDHHPRLHQRPERARSGAQGHAPGARRRRQHDPDLDRRRRRRRPGAAGAQGQARRHGHPRADAQRVGGGPQVHSRPRDQRGRDQQGHGARRQAAAQGHPRRDQRAARLDRLQPQPELVDLRPDADADRRRPAGAGAGLVRQRVGLLQPHGRHGRGHGQAG